VFEARMASASGTLSRAVLVWVKALACSMMEAFVPPLREISSKTAFGPAAFPADLGDDEMPDANKRPPLRMSGQRATKKAYDGQRPRGGIRPFAESQSCQPSGIVAPAVRN
jgi:hypothetical protein